MDDATLVGSARNGDDAAWAAIYDRYADKLHDHCHRILRDRDEAADALHDAFLAASRNLEQLRDPTRLRPWLYSICRHTSLRRLKARDRVELTDAPDELMAADADLDRGVRTEELTALVWAAAAGLNGRDQALLDLHLRQGLEGQDLADAMGTSLNNSYVMLSRMRDQVERSLGALLIARLGRDDCNELDALLTGWDGRFSPLLRKRVARHVDGCSTCSERRKSVVSPLALLAAAPLVPAPTLLKARVISSIRNVDVVDPPHVPFTKAGYAVLTDEAAPRKRAALVAAVAAVVLLLGGVFLLRGDGGDRTVLASDAGSSTSQPRTRATTPDGSTIPTIEGTSSTVDAGGGADDGGTGGGGSGTTRTTAKPDPGGATGGAGQSTTTAQPTTTTIDTRDPDIISASVDETCLPNGRKTVTVTARASDAGSGVASARVIATGVGTRPMANTGGDTWEVTFEAPSGNVTATLQVSDHAGNRNSFDGGLPIRKSCPPPPPSTSTSTSTTVGTPPAIG